ncbi:MAG: hypothetical protein QW304_09235 [Thermoproteota archaeon]
MRRLREELQNTSSQLQGLAGRASELKNEVERLTMEHGSPETMMEKRSRIQEEIQILRRSIEGLEAYSRIRIDCAVSN